jgi:dethiobiotin synthetase
MGTGTMPGKTLLSTALQRSSPGFYTRIAGKNDDYAHVKRYAQKTKFLEHKAGEAFIPQFQSIYSRLSDEKGNWVIETEGGIMSPLVDGFQAEIFRRLPNTHHMLVGDDSPNGISATLLTYEALVNRSFDIQAIFFFQPRNLQFEKYVSCPVMYLPSPPKQTQELMLDYTNMLVWYESIQSTIDEIIEDLD